MIGRLYRMLSSIRFTLFLLIALLVVFLLGQWIPQKGVVSRDLYLQWRAAVPGVVTALEWLGFTTIYTAPVTLALWSLFFLNLALVMAQRVGVVRKRVAIIPPPDADPETAPAYPVRTRIALPEGMDPGFLPERLKALRFAFFGTSRRFAAVKNRLSPVATLLFHLSFFLILVGVAAAAYTRFSATADIAEGETFDGRLERYHAPVRLPVFGGPPAVRFTVERIDRIAEQDIPVDLTVELSDETGRRHIVGVNKPFKRDATSFVIKDLGVAPLFVLQDKRGRDLDGAYVKLDLLRSRPDRFVLQDLEFQVELFPDHAVVEGEDRTRSTELKNPVFRIEAWKGKRYLTRANVKPGGEMAVAGYRLLVPEYRFWVRFLVIKEQGLSLVYAGFATAVAALLWRFLFYRRELIGAVREENGRSVLFLAGRAEFYQALFEDELERAARAIAGGDGAP